MIKTSRSGGFTLIELLVVISIIALLAGLAFPALDGAMRAAQKAQASAMCNQLSISVTMYNTEYGTWPVPANTAADYTFDSESQWSDFCKAFNGNKKFDGSAATSPIPNPRAIQFMSFNKKDRATASSEAIQSPVKKGRDRWYRMVVDGDYDNIIEIEDVSKSNGKSKYTLGVGAWAYGDGSTDNTKKVSSYR